MSPVGIGTGTYNPNIDRDRAILYNLFVEIEEHVISHEPCEIASSYLSQPEITIRYDFRGLVFHPDVASLGFIIECSCGKRWRLSHYEFQNTRNPPDIIIREFCERINGKYVRREAMRHHFFESEYCTEWIKKEDKKEDKVQKKKQKKQKKEKTIIFDNAIEGLEI